MRIVFSAIGSGFTNNGGTKTILSCANILSDLGHEVFLASVNYDFTWFRVKPKRIKKLPSDVDVIVATAVATVEPLLKHKTKAKKIWYVRGWETWAAKESHIISLTKSIPVMVNSEWLRDKVAQHAAKPHIIYPGLDIDQFFPSGKKDDKITIGGLYHKKDLKRFDLWVSIVGKIRKDHDINIRLFGNDPKPRLAFDFEYAQQPNPKQHRNFYSGCDIWLFTSKNEGLHIPPMEAGLCGCSIVGPDIGGVRDYAIHEKTALLGNDLVGNVKRLIENAKLRRRLSAELRSLLLNKIGPRTKNMKRMAKILRR